MKNSFEELFVLAESLKKAASGSADDAVDKPVSALEQAARNVGRSFSGSWQGYHSRVYYAGFATPPPGAHFSQEWGLMDTIGSLGSHGDWQECDADDVKNHIRALSGEPNLENAHAAAKHAAETFEDAKSEIVSILQTELEEHHDPGYDSPCSRNANPTAHGNYCGGKGYPPYVRNMR